MWYVDQRRRKRDDGPVASAVILNHLDILAALDVKTCRQDDLVKMISPHHDETRLAAAKMMMKMISSHRVV